MADNKPKKNGRPSKFDQVKMGQVEMLAVKGWTDAEMSSFFGVTEQTWNNWKKSHPGFFESLKDWKLIADNRVEIALYSSAVGYAHPEDKVFMPAGAEKAVIVPTIKSYPPNVVACMAWLNNRKPQQWRHKREEVEGGRNADEEVGEEFL